jgi:hypothetical protein
MLVISGDRSHFFTESDSCSFSILQGQPQSAIERKRRAWSESEDDEPAQQSVEPSSGANDLSE